jgi:beta-glucosidase-like glycosyl hydrolase
LHQLSVRERGLASSFVQLPSLLSLSAAHDSDATNGLATLVAEHMRMMGFNFYLGPLLELSPSLSAAQGSIHRFGSSPEFAAEAGTEIMAVLEEHGILPMPMGFPGGGANHAPGAPAVLTTPRPVLSSQELLPYIRAIEDGARLLHVGNVLTPTLSSPPLPASQAAAVMKELLRDELGFTGVVVAGPMDGPDMAGDPRAAALAALQAGADMLLWNRADTLVMGGIAYIEAAVSQGQLSESVIDAATMRVLRLKFDHAQARGALSPPKKNLSSARKLENLALSVEKRAITVIQNRGQVLPMREDNAMPALVTGVVGARVLRDALEEYMKPISQRLITTARSLGRIERFEVERITSYVRGIRTAVLIYTGDLEADGAIAMVRGLRSNGIRVVVVLLGYPALAAQLSEADAIVLAYCDSATYDQTLLAVAKALVGEGAVGIVPVAADLEAKVGEPRVFNVLDTVRTPAGRLPMTLSELFPVGLAIPCDPQYAIRDVQWEFGDGNKSKAREATYAYTAPGRYPLTLTVTDADKETTSRTFNVVVRE